MSKILFSKFFPFLWKFFFKIFPTYDSLPYKLYGNDKKGYYALCQNGVSYKFFLNGDGTDCYTVYLYFKNEFRFKYKTQAYKNTKIVEGNILSFCQHDQFEFTHQILTHNMSDLFNINHRHDKLHIDYLHYMRFNIMGFSTNYHSDIIYNGFSVILYELDGNKPCTNVLLDDAFFCIDSEVYYGQQCFFRHIVSELKLSIGDSDFDKNEMTILNAMEGDSIYKYYRELYTIEDFLNDRYLVGKAHSNRVGYLFTIKDFMYTILHESSLYRASIFQKSLSIYNKIHLKSEIPKGFFIYYSMLDFFKQSRIRHPSYKILDLLKEQGIDVKYAETHGLNKIHSQLLDMIEY